MITADYYQNVTGELDKAAQTYQEWIESYPRESGQLINLGIVYASQGQYEKAAELTRQASALHRMMRPLRESRQRCLLALQRFDEARQIIQRGAGAKTG